MNLTRRIDADSTPRRLSCAAIPLAFESPRIAYSLAQQWARKTESGLRHPA
jgi:hypothetical protein